MKIRFEEKTYENYFNSELDRRSEIFLPLGQVQEGFLGFDSSANSINRRLWRRLGYPFWFFPPFDGIELREIAREMEHYLEITIDSLPPMKANILFQYKRPEYIKTSLGSEWPYWSKPYFRYDIYQKQQNLLNQIDSTFKDKILIVYASTTATSINELVELKINNQIIDSSNFTRAADLNGHHRNTYISSGTFSIACSEPSEIRNLNLIEELERFVSVDDQRDIDNKEFIINFAKQMTAIINQNLDFNSAFKKLNENYVKYGKNELLNSFIRMFIFRQLTGIQWLVKL